jgi:L-lysine 2,3-aminomutase
MTNEQLCSYLDVLLTPELDHITNIRIGTKALSFYPQRFLGAKHDIFFRKIDSMIKKGKHIALMAHFSHPRELRTEKAVQAIRRLRNAGVEIRTQAPLIRGINNSASVWRRMWNETVRLGMIPYYMFIERDTGAHDYFSVPLAEAYKIFTEAYSKVSGLAKTVRGPSMSANPGKALIDGIVEIDGKKKFVLKFLQARKPELVNKIFLAEYDSKATWFNELKLDFQTFSDDDSLTETMRNELFSILKS